MSQNFQTKPLKKTLYYTLFRDTKPATGNTASIIDNRFWIETFGRGLISVHNVQTGEQTSSQISFQGNPEAAFVKTLNVTVGFVSVFHENVMFYAERKEDC